MKIKATYVSIWDGDRIETSCVWDDVTRTVEEIQTVDLDEEYTTCEREFVELPDGKEIDVETNDEGDINDTSFNYIANLLNVPNI